MVELARTVRFCLPLSPRLTETAIESPRHNTFAAWPSMPGLGVYYELEVRCVGAPDPSTGYVASIGTIDRAVRDRAIPRLARAMHEQPDIEPAALLPELITAIETLVPAPLVSLTWRLTPHHSVTMETCAMHTVLLRQQFSFAAAHRLHSPHLDEDENRAAFGKCNNRHGHGHNYLLTVEVAVPLGASDAPMPFGLAELERIVDETVVQRFDHTNLNLDTAEFADVIPSVEHIARACHELLTEPIERAGAALRPVTVWETEKTSCTYPA